MRNQYLEQKPDVEELITSHMELVRQIAWYMHGRVHSSTEIDDLVQIVITGWRSAPRTTPCRKATLPAMPAISAAASWIICERTPICAAPQSRCSNRPAGRA